METGDKVRRLVAAEAARLMYEEGVREYRDAKRKAAKKFGAGSALALGSHLPSNAEIHAEVGRLIGLHERDVLPDRLLRYRLVALKNMELLEPFHPRLVGSVLSGAVTDKSDIDLHLFAEAAEEVEEYLEKKEIPFDLEVVTVRHGSEFREYPHVFLEDDGILIECSIYPLAEMRRIPTSSITGKPMARAGTKELRKLLAAMAGSEPPG